MELTKEMFNKNWEDHTFQTAFKSHVKRYRKAVTGNPNTFVSYLYTLQDKKMKNSRNISEARRRWKAHGQGRTPAIMGRRNKDIPNQSELLVDDTDHEGGVVCHTIPTSSSAKKRKLAHNLGKAGYVYEVDNYSNLFYTHPVTYLPLILLGQPISKSYSQCPSRLLNSLFRMEQLYNISLNE